MGLEDREYLREEAKRYGGGGGGFFTGQATSGGPKRMVTILVVICVVLYLLDAFTPPIRAMIEGKEKIVSNSLFEWMALKSKEVFSSEILSAPWNLYQLVTYGFAHASMATDRSVFHILGNMFVLWMLGRMVEDRMGRYEFLYFYLFAIVFTGAFWGLFHFNKPDAIVGASGAVTAVVILFALYFPHQKVYLFGVLEIPGWLVGVLVVGQDFLMALANGTDRVAYEAHLGGAGLAALYFYFGWRFEVFVPSTLFARIFKGRPNLRVHDPDGDEDDQLDEAFERDEKMADEILEKVHREGEESLTRKERKILERFSKRVRKKNKD